MDARRYGSDLCLAALVALLALVLPSLQGTVEDVVLVGTTGVASLVLLRAVHRWPDARDVWVPSAVAGLLLTAHYGLFAVRFALRPSPLDDSIVIGLLIAATALASMATAMRSLQAAHRPFLSHGATRSTVRSALPMVFLGAISIPISDTIDRSAPVLLSVGLPAAAVAVGSWGWWRLDSAVRAVAGEDRGTERRLLFAFLALLWCNLAGFVIDASAYWSFASVTSLVLTAAASLPASAGAVGRPLEAVPVVSSPRVVRSLLPAAPLVVVATLTEVRLAAARPVVALAVAASVLLYAVTARLLDDAPRERRRRPSRRSSHIARALPDALVHDRIELHYQPIVRLDDARVVALEALLRWAPTSHASASPTEVVEAAAAHGLGTELELHIIGLVSRDLAALRRGTGDDCVQLTVNVSPAALQTAGFAGELLARAGAAGTPVRGLMVEIVETGLVGDWETLRANILELRAAGVGIALDDFGTGASNLEYLRHVPVDLVKLDRSLLGWATDGGAGPVAALLDAARAAGATVAAEGVEDDATLEAARSLGVDLVQGFHVGRPVVLTAAPISQPATPPHAAGWRGAPEPGAGSAVSSSS